MRAEVASHLRVHHHWPDFLKHEFGDNSKHAKKNHKQYKKKIQAHNTQLDLPQNSESFVYLYMDTCVQTYIYTFNFYLIHLRKSCTNHNFPSLNSPVHDVKHLGTGQFSRQLQYSLKHLIHFEFLQPHIFITFYLKILGFRTQVLNDGRHKVLVEVWLAQVSGRKIGITNIPSFRHTRTHQEMSRNKIQILGTRLI